MIPSLKAGAVYFAIVFAAGSVLGTLRFLIVRPAVGETAAVLIELPIMLAISWFTCAWITRRCAVSSHPGARAFMGAAAFLLLMAAEFALSASVFGRSMSEFAASLATAAGMIGLAGQIAFATFPLLQITAGRALRG